jgi:hypothetical protein
MKSHKKPIGALAAGAILLGGLLNQTAQAQSVLIESGTSILANVFGTTTSPEALTVSWFVVENTATAVYTYAYNVNNPSGDVMLSNTDQPTATPETVDGFSLSFNTTLPGAFIAPGTAPIGGTLQNNGANGLAWAFVPVAPGSSSPLLTYQSNLSPANGNASADGGVPPAPWSTVPFGQPVPMPRPTPEPTTTALFALALVILPFGSSLRQLFGRRATIRC